MPCRDDGSWEEARLNKAAEQRVSFAEAALCAVLSTYQKRHGVANTLNFIDCVDEAKAGITKEAIQTWWRNHQERDRVRLEEEKKHALSKLSQREKELLGLG